MDNPQNPVARQEGLVIQEMPDEVLVYDLETNKAHCLNKTAAFVWKACDGVNSVADIAKMFGNQTGGLVEENLVWLAIDRLNETNLLAEKLKTNFNNQTRREVIKKIGLTAVIALPFVASIVAPTAASAVTCSTGQGGPCTPSGGGTSVCCSGICCGNGQAACIRGTCTGSVPPPQKNQTQKNLEG